MPIARSESRSRVGVVWYDDEEEAIKAGREAQASPGAKQASIGIVQVGRDKSLDVDGLFAVVTP